ncbi:MBL fold metallo-hydrolase [Caldicellulosiruptoraceae bacterium PP1]
MQITILGSVGPYPGKDLATSGYFIKCNNKGILLECGSGVISKFLKYFDFEQIDFIICSHLHSDHISDLGVLKYYFASKNKKIDLYIPSEPIDELNQLKKGVYNIKPIEENLSFNINDIQIDFLQGIHPYKSYAVSVVYNNKKFVFSSDTGYFDNLIDFCKDSDLLLMNSCYKDIDLEKISQDKRFHLSPSQAAKIAKESNSIQLCLTHFKPEHDRIEQLKCAKNIFENTIIATEGKCIEL